MSEWIELHDSKIRGVKFENGDLEIDFEKLVILEIKDQFGFEFEDRPSRPGKIIFKNARFDSLPEIGSIGGGSIILRDLLQYGNLIPIDLEVSYSCVMTFEQGNDIIVIYADQLRVEL